MSVATQNAISLRGSTALVTEYFAYSINSILYLRGVYQPGSFETQERYGLALMVAKDPALNKYLGEVLQRIAEWLISGKVQKLSFLIVTKGTGDVIEKWEFDVSDDNDVAAITSTDGSTVQREIQAILRQINASVSFLPVLKEDVSFDICIYTDADITTPPEWEECAGKDAFTDAVEVKFRDFTTHIHRVSSAVTYKEVKTL